MENKNCAVKDSSKKRIHAEAEEGEMTGSIKYANKIQDGRKMLQLRNHFTTLLCRYRVHFLTPKLLWAGACWKRIFFSSSFAHLRNRKRQKIAVNGKTASSEKLLLVPPCLCESIENPKRHPKTKPKDFFSFFPQFLHFFHFSIFVFLVIPLPLSALSWKEMDTKCVPFPLSSFLRIPLLFSLIRLALLNFLCRTFLLPSYRTVSSG